MSYLPVGFQPGIFGLPGRPDIASGIPGPGTPNVGPTPAATPYGLFPTNVKWGDVMNVTGDFSRLAQGQAVVRFAGVPFSTAIALLGPFGGSVVVPEGAESGACQIEVNGRTVFGGSCVVSAGMSSPIPPARAPEHAGVRAWKGFGTGSQLLGDEKVPDMRPGVNWLGWGIAAAFVALGVANRHPRRRAARAAGAEETTMSYLGDDATSTHAPIAAHRVPSRATPSAVVGRLRAIAQSGSPSARTMGRPLVSRPTGPRQVITSNVTVQGFSSPRAALVLSGLKPGYPPGVQRPRTAGGAPSLSGSLTENLRGRLVGSSDQIGSGIGQPTSTSVSASRGGLGTRAPVTGGTVSDHRSTDPSAPDTFEPPPASGFPTKTVLAIGGAAVVALILLRRKR